MKVYEVMERGCFDFVAEVQTELYEKKEDAVADFLRRRENAKADAEQFLDEGERVIEEQDDWFNAYKDGYASEWEIEISIREKEIH